MRVIDLMPHVRGWTVAAEPQRCVAAMPCSTGKGLYGVSSEQCGGIWIIAPQWRHTRHLPFRRTTSLLEFAPKRITNGASGAAA